MRRSLLFMSVVGFLAFLWSAASSITRPTPFDLLSREVEEAQKSHGLSAEGKQMIDFRIRELRANHLAEVETYTTAFKIALGGLLAISGGTFGLYVYARRKGS